MCSSECFESFGQCLASASTFSFGLDFCLLPGGQFVAKEAAEYEAAVVLLLAKAVGLT